MTADVGGTKRARAICRRRGQSNPDETAHSGSGETSGARSRSKDMSAFYPLLVFRDEAEKSVCLVGDSRREIDSVAERKKVPQTIKLERRSISTADRFKERPGCWVVIIDPPVPKIAD